MMQKNIDNDNFYIVGGQRFIHKIDAIIEANKTKSEVSWYFNNDSFKTFNWTEEPAESLDYFYVQRAKQLREEFDYIIVFCSGGADSSNVVLTFLRNGIKIDEIVASVPLSGLSNFDFNNSDTSNKNTISETLYTQIPFIKQIAIDYPDVKITVHDYFQDILDFKSDDWLYRSEDWVHPSGIARYRLERQKHLVKLADSEKKIGFIYGIDKPMVVITKNKKIYIAFSDLAINVARPVFDREYPNVYNIAFYWSKYHTQMLIKQAHVVTKKVFSDASIGRYVNDLSITENMSDAQKRMRHSKYERAIVPTIYPSTATPIFQAEKPTKIFLGEHDQWFYDLHKSTRTFEMIASDTRHFYNSIDKKYLNKDGTGLITYTSAFYIGDVDNFNRIPTV
jgi:hypothetical protein